jgi:hypothetical protein
MKGESMGEAALNIIEREVTDGLIHKSLQKGTAQVDEKPQRVLRVVGAPDAPEVMKKKFKSISKYNNFEWLKSLSRGDVVSVRTWSLGPYHGVAVVSYVTSTLISMIDGKKFNRQDGFSCDENKLLIGPLTERARYVIITKVRNKLGMEVER